MSCHLSSYLAVRDRIQPGDIIAFSGHGLSSNVVKIATDSVVSHVGIVLTARMTERGLTHEMIESMPVEGATGVTIRDLQERALTHKSILWWLPLSPTARRRLDVGRLQAFLQQQDGKVYDFVQAIHAGVDLTIPWLSHVGHAVENHEAWFCSELVAAGLKAGGLLPKVNVSEMTPKELCTLALFQDEYYQLNGNWPCHIVGFNACAC